MWKDFFYFTRAQQAGVIALAALLAVAIGVNVWQARVQHVPPGALAADTLFVQEVEAFKRTLQSRDSLERAERERLFEDIFMAKPYPSKITAGRLELTFDGAKDLAYSLDYKNAFVDIYADNRVIARLFISTGAAGVGVMPPRRF